MTIADIKAALAAKAAASNIKPACPVIETPTTAAATINGNQQPAFAEQEPQKPKTRARKTPAKKQKTTEQQPVVQVVAAPEAAIVPEPPTPIEAKQPAKATTKKSTTRKSSTRKTEHANASIVTEPIEAIIAAHLKPGIDYNTIPGCGRKPALMKAGAEHLAAIFGFRSTSEVIHRIEALKEGFVLYEIATKIYDQEGNVVAVGLGSCNTRERRYQRDFAGSLNTTMKMAKKRSYVDAILTATHSSGVFTQDIEDLRDLHEVSEQTAQEA